MGSCVVSNMMTVWLLRRHSDDGAVAWGQGDNGVTVVGQAASSGRVMS
jgi:hypothetical protein